MPSEVGVEVLDGPAAAARSSVAGAAREAWARSKSVRSPCGENGELTPEAVMPGGSCVQLPAPRRLFRIPASRSAS